MLAIHFWDKDAAFIPHLRRKANERFTWHCVRTCEQMCYNANAYDLTIILFFYVRYNS